MGLASLPLGTSHARTCQAVSMEGAQQPFSPAGSAHTCIPCERPRVRQLGGGHGTQTLTRLCMKSSAITGKSRALSALSFPNGKRRDSDEAFRGLHVCLRVFLGDACVAAHTEMLPLP